MADAIARRRLIDLSHVVEHGMVTYKGLPGPAISAHMSRADARGRYLPGNDFFIGRIDMVANTGTYVDSPYHLFEDRADLADLPLASLAGVECLVARVAAGSGRAIATVPFAAAEIRGRAVLFHTGWDRHWRSEAYSEGHPHLTGELAEELARAGALLVGIDSFNIDATDTGDRPVHRTLLSHDIPIVEHLTGLEALPERGALFFAVPVMVRRFGSFPVRAFAMV